jgi:hypothetical protein
MIRFILAVAFGTVLSAATHAEPFRKPVAQAAEQAHFYSLGDKALVRCSHLLIGQIVHLDCEKLVTPAADKK